MKVEFRSKITSYDFPSCQTSKALDRLCNTCNSFPVTKTDGIMRHDCRSQVSHPRPLRRSNGQHKQMQHQHSTGEISDLWLCTKPADISPQIARLRPFNVSIHLNPGSSVLGFSAHGERSDHKLQGGIEGNNSVRVW